MSWFLYEPHCEKIGLRVVFKCWHFSHEPSSLFHHSVLADLSVSMMMH